MNFGSRRQKGQELRGGGRSCCSSVFRKWCSDQRQAATSDEVKNAGKGDGNE